MARSAARVALVIALVPIAWPDRAGAQSETLTVASAEESRWGAGWSDRTRHQRPVQLAVMALLYGSFTDVVAGPTHNVFGPGVSVRGTIPLLHDGLVARRNDALDLELGTDVYAGIPDRYHPRSFVGIVPDLSLRWTFYTGRASAMYVKAGAQIDIGVGRSWWPFFVWPSGAFGMLFGVGPRLELKLELGWPALRAGLAFDIF